MLRQGPLLTWDATSPDAVRAMFDDGKTRATVEFQVDHEGRSVRVTASNRPRLDGRTLVETPWSASVSEYRTFGRIRVPSVAEATWHLPEGPFTYWRVRLTEFEALP